MSKNKGHKTHCWETQSERSEQGPFLTHGLRNQMQGQARTEAPDLKYPSNGSDGNPTPRCHGTSEALIKRLPVCSVVKALPPANLPR